jgi:hypothetical protein
MTKDGMRAITITGIDPRIYREFKAACITDEISVRQAIINFIADYAKMEEGKIKGGRKNAKI